MLKAIESPITQRTLVRPGDFALVHVQRRLSQRSDCWIVGIEATCDGVRDGRREVMQFVRGGFGGSHCG